VPTEGAPLSGHQVSLPAPRKAGEAHRNGERLRCFENGGTVEKVRQMAARASPRTPQPCDRRARTGSPPSGGDDQCSRLGHPIGGMVERLMRQPSEHSPSRYSAHRFLDLRHGVVTDLVQVDMGKVG
jgi:hypothetical protein